MGDSRIGIILIQHVSWNGGQLAWRELILLICVSELWRQFCAAYRAEAERGEEVSSELVIAGGDAPEILARSEHAFDGIPIAVEERRETVLPAPAPKFVAEGDSINING